LSPEEEEIEDLKEEMRETNRKNHSQEELIEKL
jgi:hypothetical protein